LYVSPSTPLYPLFFSFYLSVHFPIPFLVHSPYHSLSISLIFIYFWVFSISLILPITVRFCFHTPFVTPCHNCFPSFFLCVFLSLPFSHSPFRSSNFVFQFYFIVKFFFMYFFFVSLSLLPTVSFFLFFFFVLCFPYLSISLFLSQIFPFPIFLYFISVLFLYSPS
jgi:hypothetical protein